MPFVQSVTLAVEECLRLLASAEIGRVVYTDGALPAVTPVNFVYDASGDIGTIVLRTAVTSRLASRLPGSVVAFEVDELDRDTHTGWSVVVTGACRRIEDPLRLAEIQRLHLVPWVPGERPVVLEIETTIVTGMAIR